ncbi:MAG: diguanylate cyclase response regulator, partial [Desulfuromonas sp.]
YLEAEDGLEAFKTLLGNPVDVVLCDLEMPGMDGLKFLGMRNSRPELMHIPVILLTGSESREQKVKGLEQGASDYVVKPFDSEELIARVRVQLKLKRLQDDLKAQNLKLEKLSNIDPLTEIANRRALMRALESESQRSERRGHPLSLLMVDIDHFKKINDRFGHQQGDLVLKAVAGAINDGLRDYDLAARFGGEEFTLMLPETDLARAAQVAERVRAKIAGLRLGGRLGSLQVTVSLGVASRPSPDIQNVDDLIRIADDALYEAKQEGRNRVVVASSS